MKQFFSAVVGGAVAFAMAMGFVFILGQNTSVTVFGADTTLLFFESFFICMLSSLVVEWIQGSGIGDVVADAFASIIVSGALAFYTAQPTTVRWLTQANAWNATKVLTVCASVTVIFAAFFSTAFISKINEIKKDCGET